MTGAPGPGPRRRNLLIAGLLFVLCFGVYAALAGPRMEGYEAETAAVAEGIVRGYGAEVPPDTPLVFSEDIPFVVNQAGTSSRTGILQPVLMVPFYAAGAGVDQVLSGGDDYTYRSFLLRLYSSVVTALAAALVFLLVRALGRSEGWALTISLLFAFASLALPYSGMGMEPTGMLVVIAAFLVAAHAARSRNPWLWALTGLVVGLAASTRPSTVTGALGALVLLWPALRDSAGGERRRLLGALGAPIALGALAFLGYNLYRFDDPFDTGYTGITYSVTEAPFAAIGLFLSPGKGLLWYSPLVILGILGLVAMWRRERTVALALIAGVALGALPYLTPFWSDDTWGPRYLLSVAWMLLVPIAWWATTPNRRFAVGAVAALAVCIQLAGTLVSFTAQSSLLLRGEYTGVKVYGPYVGLSRDDIPYGDDPVRWIPELSQLRFNSEALISIGGRNLGLDDRELAYEPFRGRKGSADLSEVSLDVWWNPGALTFGAPKPTSLWLAPFLLLAAGGAWGLVAIGAGRASAERPDTGKPA